MTITHTLMVMYAKEHPDETVKSIYVQDNGVVIIKTKQEISYVIS